MKLTKDKIIKKFKREVITSITGLSYPEAMRTDVIKAGILMGEYFQFLFEKKLVDAKMAEQLDLFAASEIVKYGEMKWTEKPTLKLSMSRLV